MACVNMKSGQTHSHLVQNVSSVVYPWPGQNTDIMQQLAILSYSVHIREYSRSISSQCDSGIRLYVSSAAGAAGHKKPFVAVGCHTAAWQHPSSSKMRTGACQGQASTKPGVGSPHFYYTIVQNPSKKLAPKTAVAPQPTGWHES